MKALREIDILRVKKAEKATENMSKEARQARRRQKRLLEDENEAGDQIMVRGSSEGTKW